MRTLGMQLSELAHTKFLKLCSNKLNFITWKIIGGKNNVLSEQQIFLPRGWLKKCEQ